MKSGTIKFILVSIGDSPDALTDKLYWRKAKGANGIASRSYPGYVDTSHSANVGKSHSCVGGKSPGPMLPHGAACAMDSKWSCLGDTAQARFRHGERLAE